jgi:hypothetical protein
MKTKTLKAFTEQVNKLNKEECDALNKENNLFFCGTRSLSRINDGILF